MNKEAFLLQLNKRWKCDVNFGWIPVTGNEIIDHTEIYEAAALSHYIEQLKSIIVNNIGCNSLLELSEDGYFSEKNICACDFEYDGLEYIYSNYNLDFVLYFSHENSVTIGGKMLLENLHEIWPDSRKCIWNPAGS